MRFDRRGGVGLWQAPKLAIVLALLVLLAPRPARSAKGALLPTTTHHFQRVDTIYGFPQGSIYSVAEGDDGYLWLTTLQGLVRFDGLRYQAFDRSTNPELPTSRLTVVHVHEASGDLWIGSEDGRLIRRRDDRFTTLPATNLDLGGATAIVVSDDGGRVTVFRKNGVEEFIVVDETKPELLPAGPPLRGFGAYGCRAVVGVEYLWYADERGFLQGLPIPSQLFAPEPLCRGGDGAGLWLRGEEGEVWRLDDGGLAVDPRSALIPGGAVPLGDDDDGGLWLRFRSAPYLGHLANDGRVTRYDEPHGVDAFGDPVIVHVDREGGQWVGTTIGFYRHLGGAFSNLRFVAEGLDVEVSAHHRMADGTVWISGRNNLIALQPDGEYIAYSEGDGSGLLRPDRLLDQDGQAWSGGPHRMTAARVFREDDAGQLWIGAYTGLYAPNEDGTLRVSKSPFDEGGVHRGVNDILVDEGGLWLATLRGVVRVESGRVTRSFGPEEGIRVGALALHADREGRLWVATKAGVLWINDGRLERAPGLGEELGQVRAFHEDPMGRIWIGTYDRGLYRWLPGGEIESVGLQEGLVGGVFSFHFDDRGFLWTSSNRGILRARADELDRALRGLERQVATVIYDRASGMPISECNGGFASAAYPCEGGAWCVSTLRGIIVVRTDSVHVNMTPPLPKIEEFWVDGSLRAIEGGRVTIAPGDRDIAIHYSGITFERAEEVMFSYRLRGHDERWGGIETSRIAHFNDLPPGDYTFEVLAESSEGVQSPLPARLAITVEPAWWELAIVQVAAGLLLFGFGVFVIRLRLREIGRARDREEARLRRTAEELEARVRERTAVLNAEVLVRRRAEKAAMAASESKSMFVAQMSHELRTPLNAIIGLSELLAKTPLTEEQRRWAKTVSVSGDALLSIIDDILDFSRVEAGELKLDVDSFDPVELVEETIALVALQAEGKGLNLDWHAAPGVPGRIVSDRARLRQVLLNLLNNAIKFTSEGSVHVEVSADVGAEEDLLSIAVRDTGPGIAPEQCKRIFEPFCQVDASTSRQFGGSGLGLAIVHRLSGALGGSVELKSSVGVGSTFTVKVRADSPVGSVAEATATESEPSREPQRGLRVLLVEDEPVNQMVAEAMVTGGGHRCTTVASGEEALVRVAGEDFDAILMDLHMPGMSGLETVRRIQAELARERQPWIIALTASATVEERQRCFAQGIDDFLSKPVREAEILGALGRAPWRGELDQSVAGSSRASL